MGLFSKFKRSKTDCIAAEARDNPESTAAPHSPRDLSSPITPPNVSSLPYTTSASNLTSSKASPKSPPPGHKPDSNLNWPVVPRAGDYEARIAQIEADSKLHPHKKSWIKEKFDLAGPEDREYYERRFKASGEGSDYEKVGKIAMLAGGGIIA